MPVPSRRAFASSPRKGTARIDVRQTFASPRSSVASGATLNGRVPTNVYGLRLRQMSKPPSTFVPVGVGDREVGPGAVVGDEEGAEPGVDEEGVARVALQLGPLLDLLDERGVPADADVEEEVAAVDRSEPDRPDPPLPKRVGDHHRRVDRLVGEADGPGEHVGRAARQGGQGAVGADDPVGDLVQRAVAAEHDDHVGARSGRVERELAGVAASVGLDGVDVVVGREQRADDHLAPCRHRRRGRVDDQQDLHERARLQGPGFVTTGEAGQTSIHERRRLRQADPGPG